MSKKIIIKVLCILLSIVPAIFLTLQLLKLLQQQFQMYNPMPIKPDTNIDS